MFWKDDLSKKFHWNMIFLVISGGSVFLFSQKYIFSLDQKYKMIFLKKYMEK